MWRDCTDDGVGIVAVLIEDSKCERNMSTIPYYLHISTLTSNHLIRIYRGAGVALSVRAPRRTPLPLSRPEDCIRAKSK